MFDASRMRLLFVVADPGRLRYFESPLEVLARRRARVHVIIERPRERIAGQMRFIEDLVARSPTITWGAGPRPDAAEWTAFRRELGAAYDAVHYQQSGFDGAPEFRARAKEASPRYARAASALLPSRGARAQTTLARAVLGAANAAPVAPNLRAAVREHRPDVVLVSPLFWFGSPQSEWIRAAKAEGVRTMGCLFSWDNLTSKGALRATPDALTVWNQAQAEEAATLHGVPRGRIVVTGAQNWDHWVDWKPSRTREQFAEEVGFPLDRPYILFLESSSYMGGEGAFGREWLTFIRNAQNPAVRDAHVVIRPHPQAIRDEWAPVAGLGGVTVWPREGKVPLDRPAREDFFDSMHHATAVVGVNTSSFLEAAMFERPALTVTPPELARAQSHTVHFRHLLSENGGPVISAPTLEAHVEQLGRVLAGDWSVEPSRAFVRRFLRPHGLQSRAAEHWVAAVEELCRRPAPRPVAPSRVDRIGERVLSPYAGRLSRHQRERTAAKRGEPR
ncbi:MAG: hypothetical protein WKF94_02845 [Solirubrobacteraceae bacterium]